jgi:hypothetical protein
VSIGGYITFFYLLPAPTLLHVAAFDGWIVGLESLWMAYRPIQIGAAGQG